MKLKKIIETCGFHCIKIKHLGVSFGEQVVLDDVNLHIHCGSLNAIIGKNGAGKSTLVRAILKDVPTVGTIEYRDTKNGKMKDLKIGYVPQAINIEKNTPLSVYDLIASFQYHYPVFLPKNKRIYEEIKKHLETFEAADLIDKQVCNLSGGQLQRVLLSMAVADKPKLLLLDEPVSGIDKNGMELFYKTITYLKEHYDLAIILISHDLDYVKKYADHVVLLDRTVLKQGTVTEVFESPEFRSVFSVESENVWIHGMASDMQEKTTILDAGNEDWKYELPAKGIDEQPQRTSRKNVVQWTRGQNEILGKINKKEETKND